MTEQQQQHISALVDEEIDPALVKATISALEANQGLSESWERYHLIGAGIRSEPVRKEYREIAGLVSARIASEPVPISPSAPRQLRGSRLVPFAGAALAASAAFFAVFAVPQLFEPNPGATGPEIAKRATSTPAPLYATSPAQRWHVDEPALESKLDHFLVNHQEQSRASGMKGFLPYATVVGYESGR